MYRSTQRRRSNRNVPLIAVITVLALAAGSIIAMTQVSSAEERRSSEQVECPEVPGADSPDGDNTTATQQNGRVVRNHWGDGQEVPDECDSSDGDQDNDGDQAGDGDQNNDGDQAGDGDQNDGDQNDGDQNNDDDQNNDENNNQIDEGDILADNCEGDSELEPHDGFQNGNRCVDTEMGEVGNDEANPSLLITDFPEQVEVNEPFQIRVSTRNLIRDRFLAAGQGGYYVEMSKLNEQGLVRGHFHTACRILDNDDEAPDPEPAPAFFVATEDGGGSAQPDEIVIEVPGLPEAGTAQCASWAGDGSHRLPMMQRANQTPAFDAVRVQVG
jgi:hypothetical protein